MDEDALPTVAIAVLCVVATGFAASALPSSLSTDPREAVTDGGVPIVSEVAVHVRPLAELLADELRGDVTPPPETTDPPTLSATPPADVDVHGDGTPPRGVTAAGEAGAGSAEGTSAPDSESGGGVPDAVLTLPLLGLIAGVGWVLRRARGRSGGDGDRSDAARGRVGGRVARGTPPVPERTADAPAESNAVYRSWAALLDAADVRYPTARTPAECAARAIDAGMDPEAVARLRAVFEEVRYGDRPVTDRRVRRAERALRDAGVER